MTEWLPARKSLSPGDSKLGQEPSANPGWLLGAFFALKMMPVFNVDGGLSKIIHERIVKGSSERTKKEQKKKNTCNGFSCSPACPYLQPQTPEMQPLCTALFLFLP